jgi:hypothetical protein
LGSEKAKKAELCDLGLLEGLLVRIFIMFDFGLVGWPVKKSGW